jgi:hypothetical protein
MEGYRCRFGLNPGFVEAGPPARCAPPCTARRAMCAPSNWTATPSSSARCSSPSAPRSKAACRPLVLALLRAARAPARGEPLMLLMIDNYDSFTFNLVQYFGELGADVRVFRNDEITLRGHCRAEAGRSWCCRRAPCPSPTPKR